MNAVEIEEAVSLLAEQPFEADAFPYAFLEAFGNKATTIKRLKSGATNKSDVGGVLQRGNIHIKICGEGEVAATLDALRDSPSTAKQKARFILATDGSEFQAEDLEGGDTIACDFADFSNYFGFFLELAGISTVRQIKENAFDIKATSRLNRLYVELLKDNPEWGTEARRHEMNHFMARLIFCFFAEDTDIFNGSGLFTATVEQMSDRDSSNTHEIIAEIFRAMDTKIEDRAAGNFRPWANQFPLVNGGLFSGSLEAPRFSRIARAYLIQVGKLDWTKINPDIFGSMIQAVADDEERGALGMHYTSVPNILKVLNPLFLDDLRAKLEEAEDNGRKLLNLRNRIARIRVFDPACGSGNFLVIAYKEMRAIEAEINLRREERERRTDIPLTNFRGIELRDFSAEVARLALIIAEYQCDVMYRGQKEALAEFLPLEKANWITCGNALRLDWLSICPPTGTGVKHRADDLFEGAIDQAEIEFRHESGDTYICGNPPYQGYSERQKDQNADMKLVLSALGNVKRLDYIACWFIKASEFIDASPAKAAFVSTNSLCQGEQVALIWPNIFARKQEIFFAHQSFKWKNNAKGNAGVSCVIVGIQRSAGSSKFIYSDDSIRQVEGISPYLIGGSSLVVTPRKKTLAALPEMILGSSAIDGGNLTFDADDREAILKADRKADKFIKPYLGGGDILKGNFRYCLWIPDNEVEEAINIPSIKERIEGCKTYRLGAGRDAKKAASVPHRFFYRKYRDENALVVTMTSSERRDYLPVHYLGKGVVVSNGSLVIYGAKPHIMSILSSKLHLIWVKTVCGQLETRIRYSNTLGWNNFPLPKLTNSNLEDLNRGAAEILLAREAHFPSPLVDLYDPDKMPENLRQAHERNDEVLERIYIGRRFKNDTERLEKLFELYTKMIGGEQ